MYSHRYTVHTLMHTHTHLYHMPSQTVEHFISLSQFLITNDAKKGNMPVDMGVETQMSSCDNSYQIFDVGMFALTNYFLYSAFRVTVP